MAAGSEAMQERVHAAGFPRRRPRVAGINMVHNEYSDRDLDVFISEKVMEKKGALFYTSSITEAWQVVERMMRKYFCELKLDVFLGGVSGDLWVASFYNPMKCKRFEGKGRTASLAICRAAREAYSGLVRK
jgi:hypothetical protein